jgi:hypothetical protein
MFLVFMLDDDNLRMNIGSTIGYNFNTSEQQSASHNNDLLVPTSGGLAPQNPPYVPSRSTSLIGRPPYLLGLL